MCMIIIYFDLSLIVSDLSDMAFDFVEKMYLASLALNIDIESLKGKYST